MKTTHASHNRDHKSANNWNNTHAVCDDKENETLFFNVPIPACFIATTFALISLRNDLATMLASILVPFAGSARTSGFLSEEVTVDDIIIMKQN